ncbi:MAG: SOS response-associated peptidase [Syntrophaceae bacterium]|nr:SOS response-associated peptidase [Syntrophaceae bacterium]
MCGRFILTSGGKELAEHFVLTTEPEVTPRYNIAPTQEVATIRLDSDGKGKRLAYLKWGLVPFWAKAPPIGSSLINARCETVSQKPAFRAVFKRRRLLIPANGFYEWMKKEDTKQPYLIQLADRSPFAFAGLWDHWEGQENVVLESCTIITTETNDLLRPIHDRMSVIISRNDYDSWLNLKVSDQELWHPYPSDEMICFPVNPKVNRSSHEKPDCIEPALRD